MTDAIHRLITKLRRERNELVAVILCGIGRPHSWIAERLERKSALDRRIRELLTENNPAWTARRES